METTKTDEKGNSFELRPLEEVKDIDDFIKRLAKLKTDFDSITEFNEGDIVYWKDGLKNKRIPDYGDLGIVMKVLNPPVIDRQEISSTYFNEILDLQLGFITSNGEFITFVHDSRRFSKIKH
jgi:hypothetical protein